MAKEYSQPQKQAICDAMTTMLENLSGSDCYTITMRAWLLCSVPGKLSRAMHVDVTWDDDQGKFIYQ